MPGLQGEHVVAALGSPIKKSKMSLKFFQKKETKRALDFSEPPPEDPKTAIEDLEEPPASGDQVVPGPALCPTSPGLVPAGEKREALVPFVGLNNLGNTCYLNSILQVLYYCPGLRDGIKKLYDQQSKRQDKPRPEQPVKSDEETEDLEESLPAHMQLLESFNNLIASVEHLQSSFLLSPGKYSDGELATPPRRLLQTLRQLNPMYKGYLQHDAQEVLQCILGYIQEACDTIKKEQGDGDDDDDDAVIEVKPDASGTTVAKSLSEDEGQTSGKRKSDTEVGNAKKKPKSVKWKKNPPEDDGGKRPFTRSKRKSSGDITLDRAKDNEKEEKEEEEEEEGEKKRCAGGEEEEGEGEIEGKCGKEGKRKKRAKLGWLRPSGKQPSIFSKFRSMGRISSITGTKSHGRPDQGNGAKDHGPARGGKTAAPDAAEDKTPAKSQGCDDGLDLMERLFQGRLVLRTRCLECENYTERREDFQDISVPVQEDQPCSPEILPEISPDPKPELKTLKWAISQFASVERIVGEDKYFCETCHHYAEAERSLLFDKTPEVITIHLKCFSANGLELDPYAGLSKVNTPLQTPLTLSLDEWCTRPTPTGGRQYQLFAVVMHSGVTISSGHYTTYIRMSDLRDTRLWPQDKKEGEEEEEEDKKKKEEGEGEGSRASESKEEVLDYDDGEVSFSLRGKRNGGVDPGSGPSGKTGSKKTSEGVGLLGGQRSVLSYDISGKQPDKATSSGSTTEGSRRRRTIGGLGNGLKKEPGAGKVSEAGSGVKAEGDQAAGCSGPVASEQQALGGLLEYEGKWLLFDDSEVRLFEEQDFLRACSPETCSTSTPYLLFYRRIPHPDH